VVPLAAPNIVYAPHVYTGSLIPPDFTGDTQPLRTHIDELASEGRSVPAPLWFGEFSINVGHAYSAQWIDAILSDFDAHDAGWAWWQWRESSGYAVRSKTGAVHARLLDLLARPYLAAAPAGVVSRYAARAVPTLRVVVPARHATALIEVAWPVSVLGTPRSGSTCGAIANWNPATARVTLTVPGGAGCVVTVSR